MLGLRRAGRPVGRVYFDIRAELFKSLRMMVGNVFIRSGLTMISDVVMSKHCVFFVSRRVGQLYSPRLKQQSYKQ